MSLSDVYSWSSATPTADGCRSHAGLKKCGLASMETTCRSWPCSTVRGFAGVSGWPIDVEKDYKTTSFMERGAWLDFQPGMLQKK